MTWMHREPVGRLQRISYIPLILAVGLVVVSGWKAWTLEPLPAATGDAAEPWIPELGRRTTYDVQDAVRAVRRDPFHPERRGPMVRYLLPEPADGRVGTSSAVAPTGAIRLLGTVVNESTGGFAMAQVGGAAPQMVYVGDILGGLTLRAVARASAQFVSSLGDTLTVELPSATSGAGG